MRELARLGSFTDSQLAACWRQRVGDVVRHPSARCRNPPGRPCLPRRGVGAYLGMKSFDDQPAARATQSGRPSGQPTEDLAMCPLPTQSELVVACDYKLPGATLALLAELVANPRAAGAKTEAA